MSTHPRIPLAKTTNWRWLWLVGGTAFPISLVMPLLVGMIPSLSIGWSLNNQLSCCPVSQIVVIAAWLLSVIPPIMLSILAMLLWRLMIRSGGLLMVGRGMLVFFLADLLTAITSFLVVTIFVFLPALFIFNSEGLGFTSLFLYQIIVAQFLYALPFLLLAGALIARWQTRSQAITV